MRRIFIGRSERSRLYLWSYAPLVLIFSSCLFLGTRIKILLASHKRWKHLPYGTKIPKLFAKSRIRTLFRRSFSSSLPLVDFLQWRMCRWVLRILITLMRIRIFLFTLKRIRIPLFTLMWIRISVFTLMRFRTSGSNFLLRSGSFFSLWCGSGSCSSSKLTRICDLWSTDFQWLYFEPLFSPLWRVCGLPFLHFEPPKSAYDM